MNRVAMLAVCASVALGLSGAVTSSAFATEPTLRYRGTGKTREALDAMHYKPFDRSLLSHLSDWNGTPVKAEELDGKVVLVVTWAGWYKVSHAAVRNAEAMHKKFKDKGLVVIGVHNPREFQTAADAAKTLGITFPYAADKDGKFRGALFADADPNIYLVDRSGAMRYAQVDTTSVEQAVAHLVSETADQARDVPADIKRKAAEADRLRRMTKDVSGAAPGESFDVQVPEFDDEAYKAAKWPFLVGKIERDDITDKINNDPPKLQNFPEEDWVPRAPGRAGKIMVLYFVDPQRPDYLNVIPTMNRLQDKYNRDAIVACFLFKVGTNLTDSDASKDDKLKERNRSFIEGLLKTRTVNHFLNPTQLRAENLEFSAEGLIPKLGDTRDELGLAILLSTDMKIRWLGNPYSQELQRTLDQLIAADPAVQARRKLEAAKSGR